MISIILPSAWRDTNDTNGFTSLIKESTWIPVSLQCNVKGCSSTTFPPPTARPWEENNPASAFCSYCISQDAFSALPAPGEPRRRVGDRRGRKKGVTKSFQTAPTGRAGASERGDALAGAKRGFQGMTQVGHPASHSLHGGRSRGEREGASPTFRCPQGLWRCRFHLALGA